MNAHQPIGVAVALALTCSVSARQAPRDTQTVSVEGTAVLRGTLTSDGAAQRPVRRALITVAGAALRSERATLTADDGTFAFERLPAGRYTLVATKPAWVASYFGSRRAGRGPGTPVALADGQRVAVAMKMLPGAVIAGIVRDHTGQPRGATVRVLESQMVNGVDTLVTVASDFSDNDGYRFYGLPPGKYMVAARNAAPEDLDGHYQQSAADIDAALRDIAAGRTTPPEAPTIRAIVPGTAMGLAPTFYPQTVDPAGAVRIDLAAGEAREGIDIELQTVPTADLVGAVVDEEGRAPQGLQLSLISPAQMAGFGSSLAAPSIVTTRDGKFARQGLTPGRYTFFARAADGPASGSPASPASTTVNRTPAAPLTLWAQAELDIDGHDVPNFTLTLQRGLNVSGHVAFDALKLTPPRDLTAIQVTLTAVATRGLNLTVPPVHVASDGTFVIAGVPPGRYLISARVPAASGAWVVDSAMLGATDVLDSTLAVVPDTDVANLAVTLTDHPAVLSGVLIDELKRPAPEYAVVAFSADRKFWTVGSRRVVTQHPAHDGTFIFGGLPAGEYYVGALTDLEGVDLADAAFLETVAAAATRVTLATGETRTLTLQIRSAPGTVVCVLFPEPRR